MSDEVVICKGRVVGINARNIYEPNGTESWDIEQVTSFLDVAPGFSTDVDVTRQSANYGAPYQEPKTLQVNGKLEFGAEYEFVMRPVKKEAHTLPTSTGPRHFKEED